MESKNNSDFLVSINLVQRPTKIGLISKETLVIKKNGVRIELNEDEVNEMISELRLDQKCDKFGFCLRCD